MDIAADEKAIMRLRGALPNRVLEVDKSVGHLNTVVEGALTELESAEVAGLGVKTEYNAFTDETTMRMDRARCEEPSMFCDSVIVACAIVAMMVIAVIASM